MGGRKKLEGPGVDYYQLPRKQLQSLCKKYGFPANKTNILMAEFLTSHLNSDEYLNRDKSLPSPAVKTRFQCRDEESTKDDNLPAISELQPTASETLARNLSHDFLNNVAERTDDQTPEASKAEEETSHETLEICPAPEAEMDFTNSGFKIRDSCLVFKNESGQGTPVRSTSTEESMDCTIKGSGVEGCVVEATDDTTTVDFETNEFSVESQKAPGEETPLPLSVMPHVRPITPERYAFSAEKGVKLFVDLETDSGLLPSENLRDYYRAWGAPLTTRAEQDKTHEDVISGSLKCFEGSESNGSLLLESHLDTGLNWTDRADKEQDGVENQLLQASTTSASCKATDATAMKSCILTPNRKLSSTLNVSFLCPPVVSSPRRITGLAGRSEIVKEWADDQNQETTFDQINEIPCTSTENAENDKLVLEALDKPSPSMQDSLALEPSEVKERTPRDLESPPEGIVEKAVSIYEEHKLSTRGPSSIQRKDSYKSSPLLKSSRIAAELERASKLGQTRRVGILALKRAMGVAPLFSDSTAEDVEKESPRDGATSSPVSDSSPTEEVVAGDAITLSTPLLASADRVGVQNDQVSGTGVSPDREPDVMEVETIPKTLSSMTENPLLVTSDATRDEATMLSTEEGIDDIDEQTIVPQIDATTGSNVEESELPLDADDAVDLPATVEGVVSNLSWMTKPIQLPSRRPVNQKLKEKPGRPFSTNGRTLELMERASAKLKMLKKSTAVTEEGVVSRPKRSTSTASVDEAQIIRECALQVEPASEVTIVKQTTEDPVTRLEKGLDTSSQLSEVETSNALVGQNGKMSIAIEEEANAQGDPDTIGSLSLERHSVCDEDFSKSEKKASEKPTVALSFLDIDFTQIRAGKQNEILQPGSVLETDSARVTRERTTADKSTPLSPLDSNRLAIITEVSSSPNPTPPTKPSGILLDVLSESEEKNNANGLSSYDKENEWCKRQEQHKTPLTGRSKEKALRAAETKAANLREQLLRRRRGMVDDI